MWTNPSPTSAFSAQTLNIDLSKYDYVKIDYFSYVGYNIRTLYIENKNENYFLLGTIDMNLVGRLGKITLSKIEFESGYVNGKNLDDSGGVPIQIYGIKGIKLPVKVLTNRTLLWENPNISQSLSAQTVNYTGTYNAYQIDWAISTSDQTIKTTYIGADYKTVSTQLWSNDTYGRKITINDGNIEWTDGTYYYGASNTWCIIKAIYGITI